MQYLTTEELAQECRTSPETCRYWRHIGKGPKSIKLGKRVLYDRADIDAWIEAERLAQGLGGPPRDRAS